MKAKTTRGPLIRWTDEERESVFRILRKKLISPDDESYIFRDGIEKAIILAKVPSRNMDGTNLARERARYKTWVRELNMKDTPDSQEPGGVLPPQVPDTLPAPSAPVVTKKVEKEDPFRLFPQKQVQELKPRPVITMKGRGSHGSYASAFAKHVETPSPVIVSRPAPAESSATTEFGKSLREKLYSSSPKPEIEVPPPAPVMNAIGNLEAAIKEVVAEERQKILSEVRELLTQHQNQTQETIAGLYGALMEYFEPSTPNKDKPASGASTLSEEAIVKTGRQVDATPPQENKPKAKRVLVVSNNEKRLAHLRYTFKDVDFTFIESNNTRQISAKGNYDVVICTRFAGQSVHEMLRREYPGKVHYSQGPGRDTERLIREKVLSSK